MNQDPALMKSFLMGFFKKKISYCNQGHLSLLAAWSLNVRLYCLNDIGQDNGMRFNGPPDAPCRPPNTPSRPPDAPSEVSEGPLVVSEGPLGASEGPL